MRIQHSMAEESQVLDAFCPPGMVDSCFIKNGYFLAASIICFLVQHRQNVLPYRYVSELTALLGKSMAIWSRKSDMSREESRVVAAVRGVLELPEETAGHTTVEATASPQANRGKNNYIGTFHLTLTNYLRVSSDRFEDDQTAFYRDTSFFDDLSSMMAEIENMDLLSLPSISMIEEWPQIS